jgi:phosphatidylinositol glycan class O
LHVLLTYITVHGLVLFMSMFWGAYFRRHLMVWKIWAPRFMLAASSSLIAILLLVVSTCIAHHVITQVKATFQTEIKP